MSQQVEAGFRASVKGTGAPDTRPILAEDTHTLARHHEASPESPPQLSAGLPHTSCFQKIKSVGDSTISELSITPMSTPGLYGTAGKV